MAKFFYKMQNILDIKEKLETQAKNEYAVANSVLAEEEEQKRLTAAAALEEAQRAEADLRRVEQDNARKQAELRLRLFFMRGCGYARAPA